MLIFPFPFTHHNTKQGQQQAANTQSHQSPTNTHNRHTQQTHTTDTHNRHTQQQGRHPHQPANTQSHQAATTPPLYLTYNGLSY